MEDAHTAELHLDEDNRTKNAFFAVYDGHGGTLFLVATCNLRHLKSTLFHANRSDRCQVCGKERL